MKFLHWLLLMLIGLKLAGLIDWSWWFVFAPIWAPMIAAFLIVFPFEVVKGVRQKRAKSKPTLR